MKKKHLQLRCSLIGVALLLMAMSSYLLQQSTAVLHQMDKHFGWGWSALVWQGVSVVVGLLFILVPTVFLLCSLGDSPRRLIPMDLPRFDYLWPAMGVAFGVAMASNLLSNLGVGVLQQMGYTALSYTPDVSGGTITILLTLLATSIIPALLEELLFRGAILQTLRPFGNRFAVGFSALLFALCHSSVVQFLPALLIGLCLGCFTVRSGSLIPGMLFHFLYNTMAVGLYMLQTTQKLTSFTILLFYGICTGFAWAGAEFLRGRFGPVFALPQMEDALPRREVVSAVCSSIPLLTGMLVFLFFTLRSVVPVTV